MRKIQKVIIHLLISLILWLLADVIKAAIITYQKK